MRLNAYAIVFGVIAAIFIAALLSTYVFNRSLNQGNLSLSSLQTYGPAPNPTHIAAWINSQPLNISQLKGKVVLIDFWTYSCINCIRTIPYLNAWYQKYGKEGLVIIGVHTPEFAFEHNYTNVYNAVKRFDIQYPVALDNNYSTWTAYNNQYWPADYLIDKNGSIRYEVFGEGDYNTTEQAIKLLLENAGYNASSGFINVTGNVNFSQIATPEIYLGYYKARAGIGNSQGFDPGQTVNYTFTNITQGNIVYLLGPWYNAPDGMVAESNDSRLFLVYRAKNVDIVAGGSSSISIGLDRRPLNQSYLGSDVHLAAGNAIATINSSRLYNIVSAPSYGVHEVAIIAKPGFKIYTFTFG